MEYFRNLAIPRQVLPSLGAAREKQGFPKLKSQVKQWKGQQPRSGQAQRGLGRQLAYNKPIVVTLEMLGPRLLYPH